MALFDYGIFAEVRHLLVCSILKTALVLLVMMEKELVLEGGNEGNLTSVPLTASSGLRMVTT
jgi:hypothetical protein